MDEIAIHAEHLSKRYRIGTGQRRYGSLRESLSGWAARPFRRMKGAVPEPAGEVWALDDVSFEVRRGEVLGIIGRNGAGKSTLLKILARITRPTRGRVHLKGRVGSLLEVGTGFHPELTGRENVYLNGAVLGMKRLEIERKFDEIVEFAEIEQFLDTPVKFYSSGMYMRLAFAVAAHLEPEILLVDEVLAVGDAAFQKKCLGKMGEISKGGRTVLFVSHNMAAVQSLCQAGLYLVKGKIEGIGSINECIAKYLKSFHAGSPSEVIFEEDTILPIQFLGIAVEAEPGSLISKHPYNQSFSIRLMVKVNHRISNTYIAVHVQDDHLNTILFSRDFEMDRDKLLERLPGLYQYRIWIPASILVPGNYFVSAHIAKSAPAQLIHGADHVCPFEIIDAGSARAETGFPWVGKVAIPLEWETNQIEGLDLQAI